MKTFEHYIENINKKNLLLELIHIDELEIKFDFINKVDDQYLDLNYFYKDKIIVIYVKNGDDSYLLLNYEIYDRFEILTAAGGIGKKMENRICKLFRIPQIKTIIKLRSNFVERCERNFNS